MGEPEENAVRRHAGHPVGAKLRASTVSPWTILVILHRYACGEPCKWLAEIYGVSPTTIARWHKQWGHEAAFVRTALTIKDVDDTRECVKRLSRSVKVAKNQLEGLEKRLSYEYGKYHESRALDPMRLGDSIPAAYAKQAKAIAALPKRKPNAGSFGGGKKNKTPEAAFPFGPGGPEGFKA